MSRPSIVPALTLLVAGVGAIAAGVAIGELVGPPDDPTGQLVALALRGAVLGLGAWATTLGTLGLLAALLGWGTAARAALRLGGARWGLAVGLGVALASTGTAGAATGPSTAAAPDTTLPVAQLVPASLPEASFVPVDDTADPIDGIEAEEATPPDLPTDDVWVVEQGDHLWSIAERVVFAEEPDADDDVVTSYWLRLIDTNRDRLLVPTEPDLIIPGQRLALPPMAFD